MGPPVEGIGHQLVGRLLARADNPAAPGDGRSMFRRHRAGLTLQEKQENPAVRTRREGAVFQERRTRVWGPPVGLSGTLRRVAGAAEDGAVADVEGCAACRERHHVIDRKVVGPMGVALVARAPVPVLATPGPEHSRAQALPGARAVQRVVAAAVRLARMLSAATPRQLVTSPQNVQSLSL